MTVEQANDLRKLLDHRDCLVRALNDIKECTCIYGTISDGKNGSPFKWTRGGDSIIGDVCLNSLVRGLFEEIADIERTINMCYICTITEEVPDHEA